MRDVKKQGGFTLIEIIVSIILIPLLWLAISTAMSVNTVMISMAKHRAQAVLVAQERLDILRNNPYSSLPTITDQPVGIDTRGTAIYADDFFGTMDITLGPVLSSHYRQVTVTIKWNEKMVGGPVGGDVKVLKEALTTYMSDNPAG